jgi:hypothetical protein
MSRCPSIPCFWCENWVRFERGQAALHTGYHEEEGAEHEALRMKPSQMSLDSDVQDLLEENHLDWNR